MSALRIPPLLEKLPASGAPGVGKFAVEEPFNTVFVKNACHALYKLNLWRNRALQFGEKFRLVIVLTIITITRGVSAVHALLTRSDEPRMVL